MAYRWVILVFGMLAYTASYFARTNYTGIAKFVAEDLNLDKASLGVMGSVFFYAYALTQMPWGIASDRFGSRSAVSVGILATALTLWGFSTSSSYLELKVWRILTGVAAAGAYVAMAGALSRWFSSKERALSQTLFAAVGATTGEMAANVLLPYLATIDIGWRQSTTVLAAVIGGMGGLCLLFLRSAPAGQQATEHRPFDWSLPSNTELWRYTMLYAGSIVAIRIVPPWLPIYAADIYLSRGMELGPAVLAGGLLSTLYLAGRLIGVPAAGFVSDRLIRQGVSRSTIAVIFLVLTIFLLALMPMGIQSTTTLAIVAFFLGASINMFPLVTSAVSESFGAQRTSSAMGFVNTFAQLAGATALALSGAVGIALKTAGGNSLDEYRGIWIVGIIGCVSMVGMALGLSKLVRQARLVADTQ